MSEAQRLIAEARNRALNRLAEEQQGVCQPPTRSAPVPTRSAPAAHSVPVGRLVEPLPDSYNQAPPSNYAQRAPSTALAQSRSEYDPRCYSSAHPQYQGQPTPQAEYIPYQTPETWPRRQPTQQPQSHQIHQEFDPLACQGAEAPDEYTGKSNYNIMSQFKDEYDISGGVEDILGQARHRAMWRSGEQNLPLYPKPASPGSRIGAEYEEEEQGPSLDDILAGAPPLDDISPPDEVPEWVGEEEGYDDLGLLPQEAFQGLGANFPMQTAQAIPPTGCDQFGLPLIRNYSAPYKERERQEARARQEREKRRQERARRAAEEAAAAAAAAEEARQQQDAAMQQQQQQQAMAARGGAIRRTGPASRPASRPTRGAPGTCPPSGSGQRQPLATMASPATVQAPASARTPTSQTATGRPPRTCPPGQRQPMATRASPAAGQAPASANTSTTQTATGRPPRTCPPGQRQPMATRASPAAGQAGPSAGTSTSRTPTGAEQRSATAEQRRQNVAAGLPLRGQKAAEAKAAKAAEAKELTKKRTQYKPPKLKSKPPPKEPTKPKAPRGLDKRRGPKDDDGDVDPVREGTYYQQYQDYYGDPGECEYYDPGAMMRPEPAWVQQQFQAPIPSPTMASPWASGQYSGQFQAPIPSPTMASPWASGQCSGQFQAPIPSPTMASPWASGQYSGNTQPANPAQYTQNPEQYMGEPLPYCIN